MWSSPRGPPHLSLPLSSPLCGPPRRVLILKKPLGHVLRFCCRWSWIPPRGQWGWGMACVPASVWGRRLAWPPAAPLGDATRSRLRGETRAGGDGRSSTCPRVTFPQEKVTWPDAEISESHVHPRNETWTCEFRPGSACGWAVQDGVVGWGESPPPRQARVTSRGARWQEFLGVTRAVPAGGPRSPPHLHVSGTRPA